MLRSRSPGRGVSEIEGSSGNRIMSRPSSRWGANRGETTGNVEVDGPEANVVLSGWLDVPKLGGTLDMGFLMVSDVGSWPPSSSVARRGCLVALSCRCRRFRIFRHTTKDINRMRTTANNVPIRVIATTAPSASRLDVA